MGVLPAASRRSRLFGHNRTHPLQSPSRRGVSSSSPTSIRGGKFSWPGLTLATETLKMFGGIGWLWNNGSFGFIIVAFPTSTFWSPMVYNMVHGVSSAGKGKSARETSERQRKWEIIHLY